MMQTKRERSVARITATSAMLDSLSDYLPEEEKHLADPVNAYDLQTYWSQSKLDQLEGKMKKALIKAKASRYDIIAPVYDQMCFDLSNKEVDTEGFAVDLTKEGNDCPFQR